MATDKLEQDFEAYSFGFSRVQLLLQLFLLLEIWFVEMLQLLVADIQAKLAPTHVCL